MNPEFLKDSRQTLRETSDIQPHQDPLEPVMSVSDDILTIRNASHTARNVYLLPMALALIISSFILFHNNLVTYDETVNSANFYMDYMKKYNGDDYFKHSKKAHDIEVYQLVDENGEISFENYISDRLSQRNGLVHLIIEIVSTLGFAAIALFFSIKTFRLPLTAEIFFDRKRQIVYSWGSGQVYGCDFKNLGYAETSMGLALFMYGEYPEVGQYNPLRIIVQPTGKALFNKPSDNTYFLGLLLKFMEEGKQAVIEEETFKRKPQPYFYKDEQPENFELRLEKVLEKDRETNG